MFRSRKWKIKETQARKTRESHISIIKLPMHALSKQNCPQLPVSWCSIFGKQNQVGPFLLDDEWKSFHSRYTWVKYGLTKAERRGLFWMKIGERSEVGKRNKDDGQRWWFFAVLFRPKEEKDVRLFFPDPVADPKIASPVWNAFALIRS